MTNAAHSILLLAQRDHWERLGDRFSGGATFHWSDMAIWGGFLAALGFAIFWFSRYSNRHDTPRVCRSPKGLFRELCRAHELDSAACRLLKQMAAGYGLPQPATLFLEPHRFAPERLPTSLAADRAQIDALKEKLFARDTDEEK